MPARPGSASVGTSHTYEHREPAVRNVAIGTLPPTAADRGGRAEHPDMAGLGPRLRAARKARRSTLEQVALQSGLTKGFLSKVEREVATPSVATLLRVCDALDMSIGELFDDGHGHALVRAGSYPRINFGGEAMRESLLTPSRERRLQIIHSVIHPGGGSGDEAYELPVDVEFVLVLDGLLELQIDDTLHQLERGDAMTFSPRVRHAFVNPSRDQDTVVIWVLAPALPVGSSDTSTESTSTD